uniref:Uncharacterized protein n=1 Tax=viral metagenome TaxID=1070528 RepID=A0A6M3J257_9ZZZZ
MTTPDTHNLILPPPSPSWFKSFLDFFPVNGQQLNDWFSNLQNSKDSTSSDMKRDLDQQFKYNYEIWKRTGGYKSSSSDLSGLTASVNEINMLQGVRTDDLVQEQLDQKANIADLGTMAYQDSDAVAITGGTIDAADITNGTMDATAITNVTIDTSAITGGTIDGAAITTGTIDNTTITNTTIDETCTVEIEAGDSAILCNIGGVIHVDTTAIGNVGVGEDDLMTFTVPANTCYTNNDILEFTAFGYFAANLNNRILRVYCDGVCIMTSPTRVVAGAWSLRGTIIRTSSTTAACESSLHWQQDRDYQETYSSVAITFTTNSIFKLTGEATANDDVQQRGLVLKWFGAHI